MEDYQKRVLEEKAELDKKINRLIAFMKTEKYQEECSVDERSRLKRQEAVMVNYSNILNERILAF